MNIEAHNNVRDAAWAEIVELGAKLKQKEPTLTEVQARVKVMQETAEGKALVKIYNDPDARLPAPAFVAKKRERATLAKLGHPTWDAVLCAKAKDIAKAEGLEFSLALKSARLMDPKLGEAADNDRAERLYGHRGNTSATAKSATAHYPGWNSLMLGIVNGIAADQRSGATEAMKYAREVAPHIATCADKL